jgi:hypothetical protein
VAPSEAVELLVGTVVVAAPLLQAVTSTINAKIVNAKVIILVCITSP